MSGSRTRPSISSVSLALGLAWNLALGPVGESLGRGETAAPAAADSAGHSLDELLQFLDGSSMHGQLRRMDREGGVRWQHPFAAQPFELKPDNLAWIRFPNSQALRAEAKPTCRFRFRNGDEVLGNLTLVDQDKIELQTWFGDRLVAQRDTVKTIVFLSPDFAVLYEGPTSLEGWVHGRLQGRWDYRAGALVCTNVALLGRDLKLSRPASVSFDLAWTGQFSLTIALYASVFDRLDYSANSYHIYLAPGFVSAQRVIAGRGSATLGQAQLPSLMGANKAHLEIRIDKEEGSVAIWLDGALVQRWKDDISGSGQGTGITFYSQMDGPMVRISNLIIAEGTGQLENLEETTAPVKDDLVHFVNHDKAMGALRGIGDGKLSFVAPQAQFQVPLPRVTQIVFRDATTQEAPRGPWEVRAYLAGGGALSFLLDKWDEKVVAGTSANFGRLAFNPRSIRQLQFNLDRRETLAESRDEAMDDLLDMKDPNE
jgi:hypothetical protein